MQNLMYRKVFKLPQRVKNGQPLTTAKEKVPEQGQSDPKQSSKTEPITQPSTEKS